MLLINVRSSLSDNKSKRNRTYFSAKKRCAAIAPCTYFYHQFKDACIDTLKFRQIKKLIECTNTSLALWLKTKRPKSVTFNYQLNTIVALDFPSPVQKPSWELNPQNHSGGPRFQNSVRWTLSTMSATSFG